MRYVRGFLNVLLACVLISVLWVGVAIVVQAVPGDRPGICGRDCY
jgi:hypothetical protein